MLGFTAGQFPSKDPDKASDNPFGQCHCQKQPLVFVLIAKLNPVLPHLLQGSCPSVPLWIMSICSEGLFFKAHQEEGHTTPKVMAPETDS